MNHQGTKVLRGKGITLRPFVLADAEGYYQYVGSQDELTTFMSWNVYRNVEDARRHMSQWIANYHQSNYYDWCIEIDGLPVGNISVTPYFHSWELSYVLAKPYWGRGYITDAVWLVFDYLFRDCGFHKIFATCCAENIGSAKVMEKCGMRQEGLLRQHFQRTSGAYSDVPLYGILSSDYLALREKRYQEQRKKTQNTD